jgi:hypothetical protein
VPDEEYGAVESGRDVDEMLRVTVEIAQLLELRTSYAAVASIITSSRRHELDHPRCCRRA